jgi:hypothetical protein
VAFDVRPARGAIQTRQVGCPTLGQKETQRNHHRHFTSRERQRPPAAISKKAERSVGVAAQYASALGKRQIAQPFKSKAAAEHALEEISSAIVVAVIGVRVLARGRHRGL